MLEVINMINKENLDERICDVEIGFSNETQTYREFIHQIEKELNRLPKNIDSYSDTELQDYYEDLTYDSYNLKGGN
jgi:hypothetical protein